MNKKLDGKVSTKVSKEKIIVKQKDIIRNTNKKNLLNLIKFIFNLKK